jgi:hypothetical protein
VAARALHHGGGDVDNATEPPLLHARQHRFHQGDGWMEVQTKRFGQVGFGDVFDATRLRADVVGHKDVDLRSGRKQRRSALGGCDISSRDDNVSATWTGPQFGGKSLQFGGVATVDDHVDTFGRQRLSARPTQPLT